MLILPASGTCSNYCGCSLKAAKSDRNDFIWCGPHDPRTMTAFLAEPIITSLNCMYKGKNTGNCSDHSASHLHYMPPSVKQHTSFYTFYGRQVYVSFHCGGYISSLLILKLHGCRNHFYTCAYVTHKFLLLAPRSTSKVSESFSTTFSKRPNDLPTAKLEVNNLSNAIFHQILFIC